MSEAELIFTALAKLSTRQIAEVEKAKGIAKNAIAGKIRWRNCQECPYCTGGQNWEKSSCRGELFTTTGRE